MANEKALERQIVQTDRAETALETVHNFVANHGNSVPSEVNWSDVATMCEIASRLEEMEEFILSIK